MTKESYDEYLKHKHLLDSDIRRIVKFLSSNSISLEKYPVLKVYNLFNDFIDYQITERNIKIEVWTPDYHEDKLIIPENYITMSNEEIIDDLESEKDYLI